MVLRKIHPDQSGFTIVELLIVIVVVAILAAMSISAFNGVQQRARDTDRRSDVSQIAKGLNLWSIGTGQQFSQMNTGVSGNPATGWFDYNYGGGSVRDILQNSNYIGRDIDDPKRGTEGNNRWRYMVVPCTATPTDNRRIVMAELEQAPSETVAQQVAPWGCTSPYISSYATTYFMNYVRMADAR